MCLHRFLFALAAFALTSSTAQAQVESTPIPMTPKPDFSNMGFMVGTWNCSTMSSRRPAPFRTTVVTTMSPDGYWLVNSSTTQKAPWMSAGLHNVDKITYDGSTNRWIDIATDDTGGYDLSVSPGWRGNTIVWTDVAYPKTNATATNNPTTYTKVSNTKYTSLNTFTEPGGRLVTVTTTCNKAS